MDSTKREAIITKLQDVLDKLIKDRPSVYERCVDITEKLFYTSNTQVVLVMNGLDFLELSTIWHQYYANYNPRLSVNIFQNFQTPHGEVKYLIVDSSVKEMSGYILQNFDKTVK